MLPWLILLEGSWTVWTGTARPEGTCLGNRSEKGRLGISSESLMESLKSQRRAQPGGTVTILSLPGHPLYRQFPQGSCFILQEVNRCDADPWR